jgi:CDP-diacylglycerol--glycerol-3-phosphate 3-phosphatidyltransferase
VERLYILAPALLGFTFLVVMLVIFSILCAIGRTPEVTGVERRKFSEILGPHLVRYMLWLIKPLERALVVGGVSPNLITSVSLALCGLSGYAIAVGHLATGAWLYGFAGITDILDGRLARATNRQSKAGALFDSVSDRWGELAVFAGAAWYLRETGWMLAVMLALAGSMMVSYTRARSEGLGVSIDGGMMQRAERIVVIALGTLAASWFAVDPGTQYYAELALGTSMLVCGSLSTLTAIGRWVAGYKALAAGDDAKAPAAEVKPRDAAPAAPNPMRITGEHTA